jgi:hypothetical protein
LPQRGKAYPLDAGGTLSCTLYSFMHRKCDTKLFRP